MVVHLFLPMVLDVLQLITYLKVDCLTLQTHLYQDSPSAAVSHVQIRIAVMIYLTAYFLLTKISVQITPKFEGPGVTDSKYSSSTSNRINKFRAG
uniref:Uncharacterized protein n=1 Tax=Oryza brachyantha TaxID=4533 RepID=J3LEU3_ORYBR